MRGPEVLFEVVDQPTSSPLHHSKVAKQNLELGDVGSKVRIQYGLRFKGNVEVQARDGSWQLHPYISFPIVVTSWTIFSKSFSKQWATRVISALYLPLPPPSLSTGAKSPKHPRNSFSRAGAPTGRQRKSARCPRPSASSRRCSTNPNSSGTWNPSAAPSFSTSASSGSPNPTPFQVKGSQSDRTST